MTDKQILGHLFVNMGLNHAYKIEVQNANYFIMHSCRLHICNTTRVNLHIEALWGFLAIKLAGIPSQKDVHNTNYDGEQHLPLFKHFHRSKNILDSLVRASIINNTKINIFINKCFGIH